MERVYRSLARPSVGRSASLACATISFLAFACGGAHPNEAPVDREYAPRPRAYPLATLLRSHAYRSIDFDAASGRLLFGARDGTTYFHERGAPRPVALSGLAGLEAIALAPGGEFLLARERDDGADGRRRLVRVERDGRRSALPLELADARPASKRNDAAPLDLVARDAAGGETLYRLDPATSIVERLGAFPPGFVVESVAADGRRVALRRPLHPEADELYLFDRERAETLLLLPEKADGRFLPQEFSPDSTALLLLTDVGADRLRLAWLRLDSRALEPIAPARERADDADGSCEPASADLSPGGEQVGVEWICDGIARFELLDLSTGAVSALPRLPSGTRAAAAHFDASGGIAVLTVAGARSSRDLVRYDGAEAQPLTWGLAPGIETTWLEASQTIRFPTGDGSTIAAEHWAPLRRASPGPHDDAALIWIENDSEPPAWGELHPFFHFLAGRGIAVLRFRLRGADGFGRSFRHAADGRPLAAAMEDVAAARDELERRHSRALRAALVAEEGWPAAVATAIAFAPTATATSRDFVAIVAAGADPDPLAGVESLAAMPEPAKSWWTTRLGDPGDAATAAARERTRRDLHAGVEPRLPLLAPETLPEFATLWRALSGPLARPWNVP
jgi:hypothetical protein